VASCFIAQFSSTLQLIFPFTRCIINSSSWMLKIYLLNLVCILFQCLRKRLLFWDVVYKQTYLCCKYTISIDSLTSNNFQMTSWTIYAMLVLDWWGTWCRGLSIRGIYNAFLIEVTSSSSNVIDSTHCCGAAFHCWWSCNGSVGNDTTTARAPALQCSSWMLNWASCHNNTGFKNLG
jgi:hypothetical protein